MMGTLSGIVEPIGALATIAAYRYLEPVLPILLALAAGAMILRGCGGTDSRVGAGQSFRYGNDRICGWICVDDDSGCGAGIKRKQAVLAWNPVV